MSDKIPVGVSACLLGENVRFDGGHKRLPFAVDELSPFVRFEAVCPEMAIGLPSPRPTLRLIKQGDDVALVNSRDGEGDVTQKCVSFPNRKWRALNICAAIWSVRNRPAAAWKE